MDPSQGNQTEKDRVPHAGGATAPAAAERHADRDDMGDSYGTGYSTRSLDEGYGEGYGEKVKKVLEKKAEREREAASNRDESGDAKVHSDFDRSQGHPIAQKEDARHSTKQDDAV